MNARQWLAVASAAHVRIGRAQGFMQVNHGKSAPLQRIRPGDGIVYYSPSEAFGVKDRFRRFTAIGFVADREPYRVLVSESFMPFRRDVAWIEAQEASIEPLLDHLELTAGKRNWGHSLRFGLVPLSDADFARIGEAMGVP